MTGSQTTNDNLLSVVVITGFLGSGKTTLVNRLLQSSGMADTAVIVNEFGEIALDHLIVEQAIENTVVLSSGCVCCSVRGDLVDTILDLGRNATRGDIPKFSRILVETTGLADPGPIVQTFASEPLLREICRLNGVVTTVDCLNGRDQLARFAEPARQVALADVVLLTKSDIATPRQAAVLVAEVRELNPTAQIRVVVNGDISPSAIFNSFAVGGDSENEHVVRWLGGMASAQGVGVGLHNEHAGELAHHDEHAAAHTHGITASCLVFEQPVPWAALRSWLSSLISLRGSDVLRIKGIVDVDGQVPVIIQTVHHLVHPPVRLIGWPDADRRTRLVVIGVELPTKGLKASLEALIASHHDQPSPPASA